MKTKEFKYIVHSEHHDIWEEDDDQEKHEKKRRATFVAEVDGTRLEICMSICNPLDNFKRSKGIEQAIENGVLYVINIPKKRDVNSFTRDVMGTICNRFDKNQARFVNRLIAHKVSK